MLSPVEALKDRVLNKKGNAGRTITTDIIDVVRSLGCLGEILGREFDVFDKDDKLLYRIKQKPITITQLNLLLKELSTLKKEDAEIEAQKWGSKRGRR